MRWRKPGEHRFRRLLERSQTFWNVLGEQKQFGR
jgi:hypothetical protein